MERKTPDGRVLMYQITEMVKNMDVESVREHGGTIKNGENFIELLQNLLLFIHNNIWMPCLVQKPKNEEHDWVLGQIVETDSGVFCTPRIVEYRESKDDWYEESIGWFKDNPDHAFDVIAWMPLPEKWDGM